LAVTYDSIAPAGTVSIAGTTIAGQLATANPNLALTLNFADTGGSGLSQKAFAVNGGSFTAPVAYGTSTTLPLAGPDGVYSIGTRVTDIAGNVVIVTKTVLLDRAGPTVALTSPVAGSSLDVGQTITFSYTPTDITGVASSSATLDGRAITNGTLLNLDTLVPGTHTIVVTAFDGLGNRSISTFTFTVSVSSASALSAAVSDGQARGLINGQTANALTNQLARVQHDLDLGLYAQARIDLADFMTLVTSQRGKKIDAKYADLLLAWARDLQSRIP
jgi:hypothetical protein